MSTFLKYNLAKYFLFAFALLFTAKANAQCAASTQKGASKIITSAESYQYTNTPAGYYAVSAQTILTKTNGTDVYVLKFAYTGNAVHSSPLSVTLRAANGDTLTKKIQLLKVVKNDNVKLRTKIYTVTLNAADVQYIQNADLDVIQINYNSNQKAINIQVNQPAILKDQLACVANL